MVVGIDDDAARAVADDNDDDDDEKRSLSSISLFRVARGTFSNDFCCVKILLFVRRNSLQYL